jgi:hypothetical protein
MAKARLLLHIGGPKTGTTAIQRALAENRQQLREQGFLYPGTEPNQQFSLFPLHKIAGFESFISSDASLWRQLVDDVNKWEGVVVLSSEILFSVPTDVVNEILEAFGALQTDVLITSRSIHELVVSQWQEAVKAGDTISLGKYADEVAQGPKNTTDASLSFWVVADYVTPIQRWSQRIGIENVIVQCVDTRQPDTTLRSFEQIAEMPPGILGTRLQAPVNRSLTYSECETMRNCNEVLHRGSASNHHHFVISPDVQREILSQMPQSDKALIGLPTSYYASIADYVNSEVQGIVNSGARIKGDVSLLTRIPQTVSDSRNVQVKLDQELIEIVLSQSLENTEHVQRRSLT